MNALFLADWYDVAFVHFRVPRAWFALLIPFELDLYEGEAYLSLIAFTQKRLRPTVGGRLAAMLAAPLAEHEFLNLRTYVRHRGQPAIYFIAEWIPNRLAQLIGPTLYGLPYRLGRHRYSVTGGQVRNRVESPDGSLEIVGGFDPSSAPQVAGAGSFDEFVLERYVAFTEYGGVTRRFEIDHEPWRWRRLRVDVPADGSVIGGHFSTGLRDVRISRPRRVTCQAACAQQSRYRPAHSGSRDCP